MMDDMPRRHLFPIGKFSAVDPDRVAAISRGHFGDTQVLVDGQWLTAGRYTDRNNNDRAVDLIGQLRRDLARWPRTEEEP